MLIDFDGTECAPHRSCISQKPFETFFSLAVIFANYGFGHLDSARMLAMSLWGYVFTPCGGRNYLALGVSRRARNELLVLHGIHLERGDLPWYRGAN